MYDRYTKRYAYQANPDNTGPDDGIPDNIIIDFHQFYRSSYPTWCEYNGVAPCGNNAINGQWYQLINGQVVPIPRDSYRTISNNDTGTQDGGPDTAFGIYDYMLLRDKSEKASLYANLELMVNPDLVWNTNFGYATSYVSGHAQWPGHREDVRPTNWCHVTPRTGVGKPGMIARLTDPFLPASLGEHVLAQGLAELPMRRHYSHLPASREIHRREAIS